MQELLHIFFIASGFFIGFSIAMVIFGDIKPDITQNEIESLKRLNLVLGGIDGLSGQEEVLAIKGILK